LPYFIPVVANYGRVHRDAGGQRQMASGQMHRWVERYHKDVEKYKKQLIKGRLVHRYRDGFGNVLPDGLDRRRYLNQVRVQKFKKIIIYLMRHLLPHRLKQDY